MRSQRTRKYTEKGLSYKISLLEERRKRLAKRILAQSAEINEMLNSHKDYVTVKEEMMEFDDKFDMLVEVHEEMLELQRGSNEAAWFGDIDEKVFAFRHKVNNWLKEAVEVRSKKLSRISSSSKHSSTSGKSRSSTKEKTTQEKLRVPELLAEAAFLEKKRACGKSHGIKNYADFLKLSIEERNKMIFKKKLCYGCYQKVSRMYNAKNCTNRKICKVCSGKHPTTLHGLVLRKDNSQKKSENKYFVLN